MSNLFDLWDFGDPSASEERFREAAEAAASDEERALALTQIARAQGLQGRFEAARETLAAADQLLVDESLARAQYWIELGRVENSCGNGAAGMPHFARCMAMAQALGGEYLAVDAAHMLAIAAPLEAQPTYAEQALRLARASVDERARRWIGPITNNLGWSCIELGQPERALSYFRESLEFRLTQGAEAPIRVARYTVGHALRVLGRFDEALAELRHAEAIGGSVGYVEEEIAECLAALGHDEEARQYFAKAYTMLKAQTDLETSEPDRLERIKERALP